EHGCNDSSRLGNDYLQILGRDDERVGTAEVGSLKKLCQGLGKTRLSRGVQGAVRLVDRPVETTEGFDPVRRRAIAEVEVAPRALDVGCVGSEQADDMRLGAPDHR